MKISGWGRFPAIDAEGFFIRTRERLARRLEGKETWIVHARGRSYGDSALNENVLFSSPFDKLVHFEPEEGIVTAESGVTLAELTEAFLPRGWFLSVTPGTKFISLGGAIASDVHGKNHHKAGCFSECVLSLDLMTPGGETVRCSRSENGELFRATCGGMGLTGVILRATVRLQRVKSAYIRETIVRRRNLEDVLQGFEQYQGSPYSVAWIDCLARGDHQGRSVLMLGEHAESGPLTLTPPKSFTLPFDSPSFLLNRYSVSLFNHVYYRSQPEFTDGRLTTIEKFFYPLDKVGCWNRMYGGKGFTQYQLVLPKACGAEGLKAVLSQVAEAGMGSFLGVLKLFGPGNENPLSFPMEGYTLALDFKIQRKLFPLLDRLDSIVLDHGGRLYLSKDARMSRQVFRKGYPEWERFSRLREEYGMNGKFCSLQSKRLGL